MSKKNKKDNNKGSEENKKRVIDLTNFISPDMVDYDENGSYTGITKDTFYGEPEQPVQDADDL